MSGSLFLKIKVWRQNSKEDSGRFEEYELSEVSPDSSFLEMLDLLNEKLSKTGLKPLEFDSDCREGICGSCSLMINGQAHGPELGTASCQLHMRKFRSGETIVIEPFRAKALPVLQDLVVDRSSLDRIISAGGYISTKSGPHCDANSILIPKDTADLAMDAAQCIGCGACIAACPNGSAALFTSAKISHLNRLPQGDPEREKRTLKMVQQMDLEGFGNCTNIGECEAACPKSISIEHIAFMKKETLSALLNTRPASQNTGGHG